MSATRTSRRIGTGLLTIASIVGVLIVALMLVPALLGYDRYVITGGSMSGTFERGSLVFEREVPVTDLKAGDVITYLPPADSGVTELVTHRILSVTEDASAPSGLVFQTKGDANAAADPWTFTLAAATQPRVEGWVPTLGWIFIGLSMPIVRMPAIGIPAALIALMYLRDLVRALRPAQAPAARVATGSPVAVSTTTITL
ncbi:signal peptidase I [Microbacterium sp. MAHUQ-60]|uniref:signal peptidase I n=1 Tax=unclassified Microbacterium TaxID=2609290 RepID=UPI00361FF583